jgi:hypothetical protein
VAACSRKDLHAAAETARVSDHGDNAPLETPREGRTRWLIAPTTAAIRARNRAGDDDDHHRTTRSNNATYAYSIATTAATTAIHARTSRTRANAPAYRSTSFSLSPSTRAGVVSTRFRDALVLVTRVIALLRSLLVHVAPPSWRSHDKSTGA